jgi:hypothetical protein
MHPDAMAPQGSTGGWTWETRGGVVVAECWVHPRRPGWWFRVLPPAAGGDVSRVAEGEPVSGIVFEGDPARGGWVKRVLMWEWYDLAAGGWPGWDRDPGCHSPCRADLPVIRHQIDRSSLEVASEFDGVAAGAFYHRNHDNVDAVTAAGHGYSVTFWFARAADRDAFVARYGAEAVPA